MGGVRPEGRAPVPGAVRPREESVSFVVPRLASPPVARPGRGGGRRWRGLAAGAGAGGCKKAVATQKISVDGRRKAPTRCPDAPATDLGTRAGEGRVRTAAGEVADPAVPGAE